MFTGLADSYKIRSSSPLTFPPFRSTLPESEEESAPGGVSLRTAEFPIISFFTVGARSSFPSEQDFLLSIEGLWVVTGCSRRYQIIFWISDYFPVRSVFFSWGCWICRRTNNLCVFFFLSCLSVGGGTSHRNARLLPKTTLAE